MARRIALSIRRIQRIDKERRVADYRIVSTLVVLHTLLQNPDPVDERRLAYIQHGLRHRTLVNIDAHDVCLGVALSHHQGNDASPRAGIQHLLSAVSPRT